MPRPAQPQSDSELTEYIARLPHGRTSFKHLVRELGLKGDARSGLEQALTRLTERGALISLKQGHYAVARSNREFVVGRLRVHRDGYGFVISDTPVEGIQGDLFIPPESAARAMNGDRVAARVLRIEPGGRADGEIVRILRRAHLYVVGEFRIKRHRYFVKPHDERLPQWIEIPEDMAIPPEGRSIDRVGVEPVAIHDVEDLEGKIVNVEVIDYGELGDEPVGRVVEVLGSPDDFGIDVEIIIRKHHLPHEFPTPVIDQATSIDPAIPAAELARRGDFRELDIVTIDGETARDFDDAVWVERRADGHYELQVHIADVSYYVRPGTPIDTEALQRGTSVYFPDRAIPMLPVELSTDLCSLVPGKDRLVLSALLEIDAQGDIVSQEFTRGVIRSAERMTYTNVFRLLDGDAELGQRYARLRQRFEWMRELALILNRKRTRRGSIDFDLPEPLIEFGAEGEMTGVIRSPRNIAHRIIEEFMLSANEAVASHLEAQSIPLIFRIHEPPDPKRIADFEEIAAAFGYTLGFAALPVKRMRNVRHTREGRKPRQDITLPDESIRVASKAYQKLIAKLEGKPEERILTYLMLRSLKQARYSAHNSGHYALAAPSYTHFTSPIRRYPDLIVHRVLGEWLDRKPPPLDEQALEEIARLSSDTERRADEAERELVEWKKAKFMEDRVGEEFDGLITSTTRFGFFVELESLFVEGLVPMETLPGDRYTFQENTRRIVGARSRREFSIGDRVRVVLDRVEAVERKLQFSLAEEPEPRGRKKRRRV